MKFLKVLLPEDNAEERRYIAEILLGEHLGLEYHIQHGKTKYSAEISLPNGNQLLIEDHFFHFFLPPLSYLVPTNIPGTTHFLRHNYNSFSTEKEIPVIFGTTQIDVLENRILCGIDILAGSFFMLTRWEEYTSLSKDEHGRFPASSSLAYKYGFLELPVVDVYAEMLWNMLVHLENDIPRKKQHFKALITHDVDIPLLWPNWFSIFKKAGGDLVKRFSPKEFLFSLKSGIRTQLGFGRDPYDTFDFLMDASDNANLQSHFFFLCNGETRYDQTFPIETPLMQVLLEAIQYRGHFIGIHPSYNTIEKAELLNSEKKALEKATGFPVRFGRQHYLRFQVPTTWQRWEDEGMDWDSTMYYPEKAGFRCGTCRPYSVFNVLTRKKLKLKEVPLTAMEITWLKYQKATPEKMFEDMSSLLQSVKKYQGNFVLLWHNSSFNTPEWEPYRGIYEKVLENI